MYKRQRNIAVALGNAPWDETILTALESRKGEHPLLDEHIAWAIAQQIERRNACIVEVQLPKKQRLVRVIEKGLPRDAVQLITDPSRAVATQMMHLNGYIDVLIPRGGKGLIKAVVEQATVPVIETGAGNCHIYVDAHAQLQMAVAIVVNAKVQRPSVCNAAEKLLIHADVANEQLPVIAKALQDHGVELRGDERARAIVPSMHAATAEDWDTEYNDLIMAVKVVDSEEEAIQHINAHNTKHSEAIITDNYQNSQQFLQQVDAAVVYVNASTRFTDGYEFGFGAEIGISTQKLHARGPMGLAALTTIKYQVLGNGEIRKN